MFSNEAGVPTCNTLLWSETPLPINSFIENREARIDVPFVQSLEGGKNEDEIETEITENVYAFSSQVSLSWSNSIKHVVPSKMYLGFPLLKSLNM